MSSHCCPTCGTPDEQQSGREPIKVTFDTVKMYDVVFLNAYPYKPMVIVGKRDEHKILSITPYEYKDSVDVVKIYSEKEFNEKGYHKKE